MVVLQTVTCLSFVGGIPFLCFSLSAALRGGGEGILLFGERRGERERLLSLSREEGGGDLECLRGDHLSRSLQWPE